MNFFIVANLLWFCSSVADLGDSVTGKDCRWINTPAAPFYCVQYIFTDHMDRKSLEKVCYPVDGPVIET